MATSSITNRHLLPYDDVKVPTCTCTWMHPKSRGIQLVALGGREEQRHTCCESDYKGRQPKHSHSGLLWLYGYQPCTQCLESNPAMEGHFTWNHLHLWCPSHSDIKKCRRVFGTIYSGLGLFVLIPLHLFFNHSSGWINHFIATTATTSKPRLS